MEPLFTTQTAYTYEEYKKFNFSVMKIKKWLCFLRGYHRQAKLHAGAYCIFAGT